MNIKARLATLAAACGLALGGILAAGAPGAQAAAYLGGVNVLGACEHQLYTNGVALTSNTAAGWRCEYNGAVIHWTYVSYRIDLNAQCAVQYGPGAYARYTSYYNPYSWGCYR